MPAPLSEGRMIRRDAANSMKLASLSPMALALFLMMIPHFNPHGKMNGDPMYIKSVVVPLIPWFTLPVIQEALAEIDTKTNVKWFEHGGRWYLHSLSWLEHQKLREDRLGADHLPSYSSTPRLLREESGSAPGIVPPKGKGKEKGKEKGEKSQEKGDDVCEGGSVVAPDAALSGAAGATKGAVNETVVIEAAIVKTARDEDREKVQTALDAYRCGEMVRADLMRILGDAGVSLVLAEEFVKKCVIVPKAKIRYCKPTALPWMGTPKERAELLANWGPS